MGYLLKTYFVTKCSSNAYLERHHGFECTIFLWDFKNHVSSQYGPCLLSRDILQYATSCSKDCTISVVNSAYNCSHRQSPYFWQHLRHLFHWGRVASLNMNWVGQFGPGNLPLTSKDFDILGNDHCLDVGRTHPSWRLWTGFLIELMPGPCPLEHLHWHITTWYFTWITYLCF